MAAGLLVVVVAACASQVTDRNGLEVVPVAQWPALADDLEKDSLLAASESSLAYFLRVPPKSRAACSTAGAFIFCCRARFDA
ncbi:MAG: hypothetical protein QNL88_01840 [Acidobacteriota bacterium]|nr:hypothetical protein [Acidobacteriota bacterium]